MSSLHFNRGLLSHTKLYDCTLHHKRSLSPNMQLHFHLKITLKTWIVCTKGTYSWVLMDSLDRFTFIISTWQNVYGLFCKKVSFNELLLTLFPRFCCWSHTGKWHHHFSIPRRHLFSQKGIDRKFYLDIVKRKKPAQNCHFTVSLVGQPNLCSFLKLLLPGCDCFSIWGNETACMELEYFFIHRIVKARIQQKIECYEVEWQNVQLGETCPMFFATIETREVIKIMNSFNWVPKGIMQLLWL